MKKLFAALIAVLLSGLINLVQAQNEPNYLCFTAVGGDASFGIENNGFYDFPEIEFSYDRNNWEPMESGVYYSLNNSQKVYLRGENRKISHDYYGDQYTRFIMTGQIAASGSVMSLLDNGTGTLNEVSERDCFTKLFLDCTSLVQAPDLPAMSVSENGYHNMFNGCTSLTKAPEIPATDMNLLSCEAMFANCTSLVEGPSVLYASAPFCYEGMFSGCINLTKAPKLPNQWVSWGCCNAMFAGCTSLETAPELPAEYLADQCYSCMFNGCSSLKYVKVHFTDWNDANYSTKDYYYDSDKAGKGWLYNVAPKGTFVCPKNLNIDVDRNGDYIPDGWEIVYLEDLSNKDDNNYLTFTAVGGDASFGMTGQNNDDWEYPTIKYSFDKKEWKDLTINGGMIDIKEGESVYLKGKNEYISRGPQQWVRFVISGKIEASGSVMSLWDEEGFSKTIPSESCFTFLFRECPITTAPELPAETLTFLCYADMFNGCKELIEAPKLPGKNLAIDCYYSMFGDCEKLEKAPEELPATILQPQCYQDMFLGCTKLTKAPKLPATTLADKCYESMFDRCSNLKEISVAFTDWGNNTYYWVYGVETTDGTFICPQSLSKEYGPSRIPESWKETDPDPDDDPNNPNSPDGSLAPITQTPESAAKSTCPGNFAEVELKFNGIERPYRYKVMGIHSDFQEWESDKNIIEIPISDDETEFGIKKYTIDFQYAEPASGSPDYIDVDVIVNFPKDYIKVIYEDIVYVDNGKHEFTDFQWVDSDGNEINNANRQFMQVLDLPQNGGQYSVKVTTESGVRLKICPQDIDPVDISKSIRCSASVYPNPIEANKEFTIKLNGFSDAMLENCNVYIYSSTGALIRTFQGVGSEIKTSLPSGSYSGTAVSGNTKTTFKLFVK